MGIFKVIKSILNSDIYIDLGTANTLVMERGRGLVANEPSVIAYQDLGVHIRKIIAVGNEAKKNMGKAPSNLVVCQPLRDGVIADLDTTEAMLKYFLGFVKNSFLGIRPNLVISLPYGVSDVEKKAVRDCGIAAGARRVILIEEPMAAALGAGLPVESAKGSMILDIGGGTTEAAVIALYGIVHCEAVRVGGRSFDTSIVEYVRKKHNLIIGEQSAEKLKITIGTVYPIGDAKTYSVRGLDFTSGLPREALVNSDEIFEALEHDILQIIKAAKLTLERTPPEIISDIIDDGVVIAGGGALITGMAERISHELKVPARLSEDPLTTVAYGGQKVIDNPNLLSKIMLN